MEAASLSSSNIDSLIDVVGGESTIDNEFPHMVSTSDHERYLKFLYPFK